jgi:hypothetical protein
MIGPELPVMILETLIGRRDRAFAGTGLPLEASTGSS